MATKSIRHNMIKISTIMKEKTFQQPAADKAGFSSLNNLILTLPKKIAPQVFSSFHSTYLSEDDWKQVNQLMINPPKPNEKLKKLLREETNHLMADYSVSI